MYLHLIFIYQAAFIISMDNKFLGRPPTFTQKKKKISFSIICTVRGFDSASVCAFVESGLSDIIWIDL